MDASDYPYPTGFPPVQTPWISGAADWTRLLPPGVILDAPWTGDPGLTRQFLLGRRLTIPAGAVGQALINAAIPGTYVRWRVALSVAMPVGAAAPPAGQSNTLRFFVTPTVENDRIMRTATAQVGGATVMFAPGRGIEIKVDNPSARPLDAIAAMDPEITAPTTLWKSDESLASPLGAELPLTIPANTQSLILLMPPAPHPAMTLTGYSPAGVVLYQEVFAPPRSPEIPISPGLTYTVQAPFGGYTINVLYNCVG